MPNPRGGLGSEGASPRGTRVCPPSALQSCRCALAYASAWLNAPRRAFPVEPVRILDAIHLASALAVRSTIPSVELLSLDDHIRRAGEQLGFRLQPS